MTSFFISYNRADKAWAEWIAWIIEEAGHTTVIQAWDFRPGGNFVLDMQRAVAKTDKTLVVLSDNYLNSAFTQPEWAAAFANDPMSQERKIIPIRVHECNPIGLLRSIVYVNLVGLEEDAARKAILDALRDRLKPEIEPPFPKSKVVRTGKEPPEFPTSSISKPRNVSYNRTNFFEERKNTLETSEPNIDPIACENSSLSIQKNQTQRTDSLRHSRLSFGNTFLLTILTTAFVMGIRFFGILELVELKLYDHLLKLRPTELQDERILIVEATKDDVNRYGGFPLSDQTLTSIIDELEKNNPAVIGLNMHRAQSRGTEEERVEFISNFRHNPNLFTVCFYGSSLDTWKPPPELIDFHSNPPLGFSNLESDTKIDNYTRRQILTFAPNRAEPTNNCPPLSFSILLADRYLTQHGFEPMKLENNLDVGKIVINRLENRFVGYQRLGNKYQIMIAYRPFDNKQSPFKKVSIHQILSNQVNPSSIAGKVVLIGTNTMDREGIGDLHMTPYGIISGVEVHTHIVSQLLDSAISGKKPIWGLPQWRFIQWGDTLWVLAWSSLSSFLVWRIKLSLKLILLLLSLAFTLYILCLLILFKGGWMPLIPPFLTMAITVGILIFPWISIRQKIFQYLQGYQQK